MLSRGQRENFSAYTGFSIVYLYTANEKMKKYLLKGNVVKNWRKLQKEYVDTCTELEEVYFKLLDRRKVLKWGRKLTEKGLIKNPNSVYNLIRNAMLSKRVSIDKIEKYKQAIRLGSELI